MPKPRKVTVEDMRSIREAIFLLLAAKALLRRAGARKAAAYAGRAVKSAGGAYRHADRIKERGPRG